MFRRPNRTIVPQSLPPKGLSVLAAAELLGDGKRAIAAQIIDLAVRKAITIAPLDVSRRNKRGFVLTYRSMDGLGVDETEFMRALFERPEPGQHLVVEPGRERKVGAALREPHKRAAARLVVGGLARARHWYERAPWGAQPLVPLAAGHPHVDYLWGVRDYIALAEKDRLAFLQSPQGARLRHDDSAQAEILVLNERLLALAVLFGLERMWAQQLGLHAQSVTAVDPHALELLDMLWIVDGDVLEGLGELVELADLFDGVGAIFGGLFEIIGSLSP